jgi:hypothetical protein
VVAEGSPGHRSITENLIETPTQPTAQVTQLSSTSALTTNTQSARPTRPPFKRSGLQEEDLAKLALSFVCESEDIKKAVAIVWKWNSQYTKA